MSKRGVLLSQRPLPDEIANLITWVEADTLGLADGAAVTSWADKTANHNDFSQATGSAQPSFVADDGDGKPSVSFGGDDFLATAALAIPSGFTVVALALATGTPPQGIANADANSGTSRMFQMHVGANLTVTGHSTSGSSGTDQTPLANLAVYNVLTLRRASSNNVEAFVNGVGDGNTATPSPANAVTRAVELGRRSAAGTNYLTGKIRAFLLYGSALSTFDRKAVEGYLGARWGVAVS